MTLLSGAVLLGAVLAAEALQQPGPADASQTRPAFAAYGCIGYCRHPTNAAKVFAWGRESWRQEFEVGELGSNWRSSHPRAIGQQHGMLTIKARPSSGTITVWPDDQAAAEGRWEARIRAVERSSSGHPYRFTWQLVPVGGDTCSADTIILATYVPGDARVRGAVRTLPDRTFDYSRKRDLRSRAWHTYAVEVTADHVSWFVDTRVMRTERRPEALAGVTYRPQLVMEATAGVQMRESWLQADWLRAYTLDRPNAQSIEAPQMRLSTRLADCPD